MYLVFAVALNYVLKYTLRSDRLKRAGRAGVAKIVLERRVTVDSYDKSRSAADRDSSPPGEPPPVR
jgi:hypothetical protein